MCLLHAFCMQLAAFSLVFVISVTSLLCVYKLCRVILTIWYDLVRFEGVM